MSLDRIRYALTGRSKLIDPQRLPGTLADETPERGQKSPAGTVRPSLLTVQGETPPPPAAPRAEAGRWQPRHDDPDDLDAYTDHTLTTMARQLEQLHRDVADLLLERADETQRANAAEAKLRDADARIRGLELTVAAQAGHAGTEAGR